MKLNPQEVRSRRKQLGITQKELARRSGLSYGTISDIERGAVLNVKEYALARLSKTLLADPEEILMEEGDNE